MKKFLSNTHVNVILVAILVIMTMMVMPATSAYAMGDEVTRLDADGDGQVTMADFETIKESLLNLTSKCKYHVADLVKARLMANADALSETTKADDEEDDLGKPYAVYRLDSAKPYEELTKAFMRDIQNFNEPVITVTEEESRITVSFEDEYCVLDAVFDKVWREVPTDTFLYEFESNEVTYQIFESGSSYRLYELPQKLLAPPIRGEWLDCVTEENNMEIKHLFESGEYELYAVTSNGSEVKFSLGNSRDFVLMFVPIADFDDNRDFVRVASVPLSSEPEIVYSIESNGSIYIVTAVG